MLTVPKFLGFRFIHPQDRKTTNSFLCQAVFQESNIARQEERHHHHEACHKRMSHVSGEDDNIYY